MKKYFVTMVVSSLFIAGCTSEGSGRNTESQIYKENPDLSLPDANFSETVSNLENSNNENDRYLYDVNDWFDKSELDEQYFSYTINSYKITTNSIPLKEKSLKLKGINNTENYGRNDISFDNIDTFTVNNLQNQIETDSMYILDKQKLITKDNYNPYNNNLFFEYSSPIMKFEYDKIKIKDLSNSKEDMRNDVNCTKPEEQILFPVNSKKYIFVGNSHGKKFKDAKTNEIFIKNLTIYDNTNRQHKDIISETHTLPDIVKALTEAEINNDLEYVLVEGTYYILLGGVFDKNTFNICGISYYTVNVGINTISGAIEYFEQNKLTNEYSKVQNISNPANSYSANIKKDDSLSGKSFTMADYSGGIQKTGFMKSCYRIHYEQNAFYLKDTFIKEYLLCTDNEKKIYEIREYFPDTDSIVFYNYEGAKAKSEFIKNFIKNNSK